MNDIKNNLVTNSSVEMDRIYLVNIIVFLKNSLVTVVISGIIGSLASLIYLKVTPDQYEARTYLEILPELALGDTPARFIERMKSTLIFDGAIIDHCELENSRSMELELKKAISLSLNSGTVPVVEIKTFRSTLALAKSCAFSVLQKIEKSQQALKSKQMNIFKDDAQIRLSKIDQEIALNQLLISRLMNSHSLSPLLDTLLGNYRKLESERKQIQSLLGSRNFDDAPQSSSIFQLDGPIYPKRVVSLILGVLAGILLGFFVAMARKILLNLRG